MLTNKLTSSVIDEEKSLVLDKLKRPIRDLRISLIDQCFLRCFYCMPKEVFGESYRFSKESDLLSYEEIERLVRAYAVCGVQKIRLTGGEPLMRPHLAKLIQRINSVEGIEDVALTTNALLLEKHIDELRDAGLHRVNISLDAIDDEVLQLMCGKKIRSQQIINGIDAALGADLPVKVNMVVARGSNISEVLPMARYMKDRGITLRFIEYMDVGTRNKWKKEEVVSGEEIRAILSTEFSLEAMEPSYSGEVARRYRYTDCGTELGFIESISKPFCGSCNRARVSSTGKLYTCLFSNEGFDLRPWLSDSAINGADLAERVGKLWQGRHDRYSEERFLPKNSTEPSDKVEMWQIGG